MGYECDEEVRLSKLTKQVTRGICDRARSWSGSWKTQIQWPQWHIRIVLLHVLFYQVCSVPLVSLASS